CSLLEKDLIALTGNDKKPLPPELKQAFIDYLKSKPHPELYQEGANHKNAALAAHLEEQPQGIDPRLLAIMDIADKLNTILRKYLQICGAETDNKKDKH